MDKGKQRPLYWQYIPTVGHMTKLKMAASMSKKDNHVNISACNLSHFPLLYIVKNRVRDKSKERHNHKPQPFPDTKRKRKQTKPNKRKSNKRTKSTKISSKTPKRENIKVILAGAIYVYIRKMFSVARTTNYSS